jgi:hypothetical protein
LAGLETRVRQVINQLCVLARGATLDFTLRVGKVVVDSLYDGDLTAWRSRARKDYALRVLAASPDLPLSATALYRALAIYELSQRQPNAWQHLGVSHLRAVLGLPNETQNHLLSAAEQGQWTVAKLEREVLCGRVKSRNNGGRKPVPPYVKAIRRIFELTLPEAFEGLESVHYLQAAEFEELAGKLTETQERLKKLSKIVASRMSGAQSRRCAPLAQANEN